MRRSSFEQMLDWKQRRGGDGYSFEQLYALQDLAHTWRDKKDDLREFAAFVPMRIVTILEVFVRDFVRELVDSGTPYIERAEALVKNGPRIDFAFLLGLQGKKVSVGDLIAHSLSISDPEGILSHLKHLIPDFRERLKRSHPRWSEEVDSWPQTPIIDDFDQMMARLGKLFNVRHILTHELPSVPPYKVEEIDDFLDAAGMLISAADWVLVEVLRGSAPQTQASMTGNAGASLDEAQQLMFSLIERIESRDDIDLALFAEVQRSWEEFANREADLHGSLVAGGSMEPMIWAQAKETEVTRRIEALTWWAARGQDEVLEN